MKFCDFGGCNQPVFSGGRCFFHYKRKPIKKKISYGRKAIEHYTKKHVKKDLDTVFCAWIRARDCNESAIGFCISCDRIFSFEKLQAGHYHPRSLAPSLIFDPDNVHAQCKECNWKEGNRLEYKPRLIAKIGCEKVEALDLKRHFKSGIGLFELKVLLLQYCTKLKQELQRINREPSTAAQKVFNRWMEGLPEKLIYQKRISNT